MQNGKSLQKIFSIFWKMKDHPAKKHIDRKLIFRLWIFFGIVLVLTGLVLYDVIQGIIDIELAFGGFLLGLFLGYITSRIFIIHWHEDNAKVVSRLDAIGATILLIYMAISLSRTWIFEHWIHGSMLTAFTFSILAGIMLGRLLGMLLKIRTILLDRGIFYSKSSIEGRI
jgi:hypothetical protein